MSRFNQEIVPVSGQITKMEIQKKRKDRINIHIEGAYAFSCHVDLIFEFKLDKGVLLDINRVKTILEADDYKMAYLYGLRIALTRSISVAGCRRKLVQLEFAEAAIDAAIDRLLENQFLDDYKYAQNYYEMKQMTYGRFRIQQELMRQGVDKNLVMEVVKDMADDEKELEEAMRIGLKKFDIQSQVLDQKTYARIYGFLARRGYSSNIVRQVMDALKSQSKLMAEKDEYE